MKIFLLFLYSSILTCVLMYFGISSNDGVISTIYNTIGIVFSIGMGLIVTFSITGVENRNYILSVRRTIIKVRQRFIVLFSVCTVLVICYGNIPKELFGIKDIKEIASNFTLSFFIFSIMYFILNFIRLQNLKNDIFDRLLQEKDSRINK